MMPAWIASRMRSMPLRLSALLIAIFTLSSLIGFGSAYFVIRSEIDAVIEEQVRQSMASYLSITDPDDLRERLVADAEAVDPAVMIVFFAPRNGPSIGNVVAFPRISGLTILSEPALSADPGDRAESYLALSAPVAGGQLVVAQSREQVIEMGEIFASVFLIGLLPTLLIGATAGMVVARRARDRVEAIRATLQDLTHGTLTSRVDGVAESTDDLDQIGLAVNRMADAQAASIAALRQVSADIAHDLRTPIQRVAIHLNRLRDGTALTAEQVGIVDTAVAETQGIVRTFQSLLHIAQIEGGSVRDRFGPVDLAQVARGMVEMFGPDAEESGHALILNVAGDARFEVGGDRQLLGQVLVNLIENGLRHVPSGGTIAVSLARRAQGIDLTVRDDGPGVPVDEREKVLRRLYRLERSRTSDGNGLGLSMVAAIADLHDATLTLDDAAPGLIVRIAFPAIG